MSAPSSARLAKALGAAIVLSESEGLIGTIVAGSGYGEGLGRWPEQVEGAKSGGLGDVAADGFTAGGVDALIVGYDRDVVSSFASAWKTLVSR